MISRATAKFSRPVAIHVITLASCRPQRSSADLDSEIESVYLEWRVTGEGDLARTIGFLVAFCSDRLFKDVRRGMKSIHMHLSPAVSFSRVSPVIAHFAVV